MSSSATSLFYLLFIQPPSPYVILMPPLAKCQRTIVRADHDALAFPPSSNPVQYYLNKKALPVIASVQSSGESFMVSESRSRYIVQSKSDRKTGRSRKGKCGALEYIEENLIYRKQL